MIYNCISLLLPVVALLYIQCSIGSSTLTVAAENNNNNNNNNNDYTITNGIKDNSVDNFVKPDHHRILKTLVRFDATIIVNDTYNFNSLISCIIDTNNNTKPIEDIVGSLKIVPSYFDYNNDDISTSSNFAQGFYLEKKFTNNKASYQISFVKNTFFGNVDVFNEPGSGYIIKPLYDTRNITNVQTYPYAFRVVSLNNENPPVLTGISTTTFALDPILVNITIDSTKYISSQSMNVSFGNTKDTYGYYKVLQVPYSYKNDPLLFNNASVVMWNIKPRTTSTWVTIIWNKPGLYQLVLFSPYGMIRGISDVFEVTPFVRRTNSTSISLDKTSYSYLDTMKITMKIENGTPPINSNVFVTFYRWNATIKDGCYYDDNPYYGGLKRTGTVRFGTQGFGWNTTSTTMVMDGTVNWLETGWYKAVLYTGTNCDSFRIVTSQTLIKIKKIPMRIDMPKRKYYRGETTILTASSPYTYLTNKEDITSWDPYPFIIIPAHVTPGVTTGYWTSEQIFKYKLVTMALDPGLYKIAIYKDNYKAGSYYLMTVSNSTFAVAANQLLISTDKNKYNNNDKIVVSVTTVRNVTLSGSYTVKISSISTKQYDPKVLTAVQTSYETAYGTSTTVQTTISINWCVSCYEKQYTVQVFYPNNYTSPAATTQFMM
jgi:hypothetical protein